jgi:hypothetical protein
MEHIVRFDPAYNKTTEGKGRHCVTARFSVRGPLGAVTFVLFTGWDHSTDRHTKDGLIACLDGMRRPPMGKPYGVSVDYHSPSPRSDDQSSRECDLLPDGLCYGDGSLVEADDALDVLTDEGEDGLWRFLEQFYRATFDGGELPPEWGRRFNVGRQAATR